MPIRSPLSRDAANLAQAVEIEVLIAQAREHRRHRHRRAAIIAVAAALLIAASAMAIRTWVAIGPASGRGTGGSLPGAHTGVVTGYIDPCAGIAPAGSMPASAAGTVRALRGRYHLRRTAAGPRKLVLPKTAVATDHVAAGQKFRFRLPPGPYVLTAHYDGGAFSLLSVTVSADVTKDRNLPDLCK